MMMTTLVTCAWLAFAASTQAAPPQSAWLNAFEGTWVVDQPRGSDADITLTITREGSILRLKALFGVEEAVTRYDLSGKDTINQALRVMAPGIFRTRIDNKKLITEIWENTVAGPPRRIETRYMESADRMVTELSSTLGGPVFNRTVLRRKSR